MYIIYIIYIAIYIMYIIYTCFIYYIYNIRILSMHVTHVGYYPYLRDEEMDTQRTKVTWAQRMQQLLHKRTSIQHHTWLSLCELGTL